MFSVNVNVGIAFLAGLASFLAPCVLPMVPVYLGYLSGYAITRGESRSSKDRLELVMHAVFFVLGFTVVFVGMGVAAGSLGRFLRGAWIHYLGGLIIIIFGLTLMEVLYIPFLYEEAKLEIRAKKEWGYLSSLLIGVVFAAGWTPCVGPALASILMLSANQSTAAQGAWLLTAYSAGVGLPFILSALLVDRLTAWLQKVNRYLPIIQKATGLLLVILGIIVFTNSFALIGDWMQKLGLGWDLGL